MPRQQTSAPITPRQQQLAMAAVITQAMDDLFTLA